MHCKNVRGELAKLLFGNKFEEPKQIVENTELLLMTDAGEDDTFLGA